MTAQAPGSAAGRGHQNLLPRGTNGRYRRLGEILLLEAGTDACMEGYGTTDPEWVGRYGLEYGDINPDGTLN